MFRSIIKYDLCIGCGLCASVLGKEKCRMELDSRGYYVPRIDIPLSKNEDKSFKDFCPAISVIGSSAKDFWGPLVSVREAWSSDDVIRKKAASGGVVTSLAIYILENRMVDAVLQVGVCDNHYLYNELKISRTREQIVNNAQSRYAPALSLNNLKEILDTTSGIYLFIGKPCDIAGVRNFLSLYPQYRHRIKMTISIFCAGMPSYNSTVRCWKMSGRDNDPVSIKYRGDGWPGFFVAKWSDSKVFKLTYTESWGKVLGRDLKFRCKICPDGIGSLSDIAVGDSWNTKDGYPDFEEGDGRCFVFLRTQLGCNIFDAAVSGKFVVSRDLNIHEIKIMQPYQYERRKLAGWRYIAVQIVTGCLLNYKNLGMLRFACMANLKVGLKNLLGTLRRIGTLNGK